MSAIHTGRIDVRAVNGRLVVTGTSEDHPVTEWDTTDTVQDVRTLIPVPRVGSTYKQVVLDTQTDDLADLSDLVPIPTLAAFVKTQPEGEGQ